MFELTPTFVHPFFDLTSNDLIWSSSDLSLDWRYRIPHETCGSCFFIGALGQNSLQIRSLEKTLRFSSHFDKTRWWFQALCYVHPYLKEMIQLDEHIFSNGWFNYVPTSETSSRFTRRRGPFQRRVLLEVRCTKHHHIISTILFKFNLAKWVALERPKCRYYQLVYIYIYIYDYTYLFILVHTYHPRWFLMLKKTVTSRITWRQGSQVIFTRYQRSRFFFPTWSRFLSATFFAPNGVEK